MEKVLFHELIDDIGEPWEPHEIAFINDTAIRAAKIEGAYEWHVHRDEDEFFMVIKGTVFIDTEAQEKCVELHEMEGYLVEKGTRHRSRTTPGEPAWILLVEPTRTKTKGR